MRFLLRAALLVLAIAAGTPASCAAEPARPVAAIKADIFALAERFAGQGDPDFSKQRQFEPLVAELVAAAPPAPLAERIGLIQGVWRQVWGPYDYRDDDRGVDPALVTDEIYQVVFPGGYYYNVSPLRSTGGRERIGLLRGEYAIARRRSDVLRVRFTDYPGSDRRPADKPIWALAAEAEAGLLEGRTSIVPSLIVRLFFGSGGLREVYTDETLRITYGASSVTNRRREAIYILRRVADGGGDQP